MHLVTNREFEIAEYETLEKGDLAGELQLLPKDYDWSDYYSQIYYRLSDAWYRTLADELERGSLKLSDGSIDPAALRACAIVRFTINRDGKVLNPFGMEETGHRALANTPLLALRKLRCPELPPEFPQDHADVIGAFTIQIKDYRAFKTQMLLRRQGLY